MVFSAVSGGVTGPSQIADVSAATVPATVSVKAVVQNNDNVEQSVRTYFAAEPVMVNIAWCESRFRQFDTSGNVFRGEVNNEDVGVMQINEHYHLDTATAENYNLYSVDGNMAYAQQLYDKFGTAPWNSSKPCWGKMDPNVATTNSLNSSSTTDKNGKTLAVASVADVKQQ